MLYYTFYLVALNTPGDGYPLKAFAARTAQLHCMILLYCCTGNILSEHRGTPELQLVFTCSFSGPITLSRGWGHRHRRQPSTPVRSPVRKDYMNMCKYVPVGIKAFWGGNGNKSRCSEPVLIVWCACPGFSSRCSGICCCSHINSSLQCSPWSGLLLWNVFENRKRTFSVFKTDRQPYGLENGPFSGEIFRSSFSGRPPLGNGAPFSINIVIETGAWIWSRHGFPHIVRGNKR